VSTVGFARVSTDRQSLEAQHDALTAAGCERIFSDKLSGSRDDRPGLAGLLDYTRTGDVVVVVALDRLGRSLSGIIRTVEALTEAGALLRSLREGIDYSTATGRMLAAIFPALAAYERELMHERVAAARDAARARGRHTGRPPRLTDAHARQVHACGPRGSRSPTSSEVRSFGVSRATIYRALSQDALFPGTVQGEGTVGLNEPPAWVGEGLYCPFRVLALARGPGLAARVADRAPRVLGLSPTRYFQLLSRLLDRPEAGRRRTRAGRPAAGSAGSTPRVAAEPVAIESGYSCRPETRAGPISPS